MQQQADEKAHRLAIHTAKMAMQLIQTYARQQAHQSKMTDQENKKAARTQRHEALMREQAANSRL